jgi:putative ABC transport system permease protein
MAAAMGTLASWAVTHFALDSPWFFLPGRLATTILGCVLLMLAFGHAATQAALRARPARLLRNL